MTPRLPLSLLTLLIAGIFPAGAGAASMAPDDIQLKLLRQFELPLRWDQVQARRPYWLGGAWPPDHQSMAMIRVPAGESLRIVAARGQLVADDVEIFLSNGSGSLLRQVPIAASDGRSLLVEGYAHTDGVVHIRRAAEDTVPKRLAFFVSRRDTLGVIAPYRGIHSLPVPEHGLRRHNEGGAQSWWRMQPGIPLSVTLRGPARFALSSRLIYPPNEGETLQHWHIGIREKEYPLATLNYQTAAESAETVFVDGRETPLTRQKEAYFELPAGEHNVTLTASASLLVRLLEQEEPDYSLPRLNEPAVPARAARGEIDSPLQLKWSFWQYENTETATALTAGKSAADTRLAALHLQHDNRRREGAMLAAAALQNAATARRDDPAVQTEANEAVGSHTYFFDLVPLHKRSQAAARTAWYLTPRLLPIGDGGKNLIAFAQHEQRLITTMDSGFFVPLAGPADYLLPERAAPSLLRLVAHGSGHYLVQFDDQPPQLIRAEKNAQIDPDDFAPNSSEAALLMLRYRHGDLAGTTLDPVFASKAMPAPFISAGVTDLTLPPTVRRVRLWREGEDQTGNRLWIAVKLQGAKPWQLSERSLLAALGEPAANGGERLARALRMAAADPDDAEIDSHLQPLARLIRNESNAMLAGVAPMQPYTGADSPLAAKARQEAEKREKEGNWIAALEQWQIASRVSNPESRADARFAKIRILERLGEHFLAEQFLKQLFFFAPTKISQKARTLLEQRYRAERDDEALLTLAAVDAGRTPSREALRRLSTALTATGKHDLAVAAGVLLPAESRPASLFTSAAREAWWQTYLTLAAAAVQPGERAFHEALAHVAQGRFPAAYAAFDQAARLGHPDAAAYSRHLASGQALYRQLREQNADGQLPSAEQLQAWGQWGADHPGERAWSDFPAAILDFAGAHSLYSPTRDTQSLAYRAEEKRPLRLRFHGPLRLRVEARPLHPQTGQPTLIEGWLQVRETTPGAPPQLWPTPITENPPAGVLSLTGDPARLPGRGVTTEFEFSAGWHDIEIDAGKLPVLIRPQFALPMFTLPGLPPLTDDTRLPPPAPALPSEAGQFDRLFGCRNCIVILPDDPEAEPYRTQRFPAAMVKNIGQLNDDIPRDTATGSPDAHAAALGKQDWRQFLTLPPPRGETRLTQYLGMLGWIAERFPEAREAVLTRANALTAAHTEIPALAAILNRINRNSGWDVVETVQSSAGERSRPLTGFEPETPAQRIREALLPPRNPNEILLSGSNRVLLSFNNPQAAKLRLILTPEEVSAQQPAAMKLRVQIDGKAPETLRMSPDTRTRNFDLTLPAGTHTLRLWIDAPVAGQFLRIGIQESGRSQFADTSERFYHVARVGEPVHLRLPGPSWVRIDEWRSGQTQSSYRLLENAWNTLTLTPRPGEREALFRIFVRAPIPEESVTPPRIVKPPLTPPLSPLTTIEARQPPATVELQDGLALGGQEAGTLSYYLAEVRRPFLRTEHGGIATLPDNEKFTELGATYRYFDEDRRLWWQGDLLGRWRAHGSPTLGLAGSLLHSPLWSSWNFGLSGQFFLQDPDWKNDGSQSNSGLGVAHSLRGFLQQRRDLTPKAWHAPEIAVFVRDTTLSTCTRDITTYHQGGVDQDVFTPAIKTHQRGLEIADTLHYRPWLDTSFYMGGRVTTNPDFNLAHPDRAKLQAGWRQLFGSVWTELGFGGTRYFSDNRRRQSELSRTWSFSAGGEIWSSTQQRLEIGFSVNRDVDAKNTWGLITLTWHGGNGRAYRDFRPDEISFRDLRERRVPQEINNRIVPLP